MTKPNYVFVNIANKKAAGATLKELRADKEKESKKNKKGKKGKEKPFVNPNQKILLNTRSSLTNDIRESNRTKILMDLEFMP